MNNSLTISSVMARLQIPLLLLLLMGSFKIIPAGHVFDFRCLLVNTLSLLERTIELPSISCWPCCTFKIVPAIYVFCFRGLLVDTVILDVLGVTSNIILNKRQRKQKKPILLVQS